MDEAPMDVAPMAISAPEAKATPAWRKKLTPPDPAALAKASLPPLLGIASFLALWALLAPLVQTSLGALPGPGEVLTSSKP